MRYTDSLLTEGEQVVMRTRQHWLALLIRGRSAILMWIGAILLLAVVLWARKPGNDLITLIPSWLALLLIIVGAVVFVYRLWQWSNQDYVVTNRRLLKVTGVLSKRSADSSLEKINDAVLTQGILARILHYGNLEVLTANEEAIDRYVMLANAVNFKKAMLNAKNQLEDGFRQPAGATRTVAGASAAPAAPAARSGNADDVTGTLAKLADLRDKGAITPAEYEAKKAELLGRL